ncbi:Uncharacterised protein (plasmid) [Tsukamurella tyrosinosolvens]|uniref:Uncharacterized protein n=1 Tax=Tsukamurella tyrosinosolvens TaxID=57704 RepID=A0A1H4UJ07_TSUTY|nr:hypothetical protein [Tsukamurella tyrosinosolvens]KXO92906.1 hypothetical protein AXK58_13610 [Tsukamurella tyrosinosolvens]SEC68580.1 hypothetical protein SAMN04489793_2916 [Tsukamurella tyrosinosolvens]VEH94255.1 Uncharacterised protein [Tsukamurella tyrosinosolvens]
MTDNNPISETTARVGEHTATVRVLDTGSVKLTPRMAAQLDKVRLDELEAFGRLDVYRHTSSVYGPGQYGYVTVLVGRDKRGDLAIANLPRVGAAPMLHSPRNSPMPRLGREKRSQYVGPDLAPVRALFEGRSCYLEPGGYGAVEDGSLAVGELDPNGNEELFRGQIAEHDRCDAHLKELLELPRILLRED